MLDPITITVLGWIVKGIVSGICSFFCTLVYKKLKKKDAVEMENVVT